MRRLAERLGAGATTLYWHVRTKDDVLDLALDAVFAEVPLPAPGGEDWRADVVALLTGWRAAMLRHPWTAALLGRPLFGPGVLARTEFLHAALVRAGFGGQRLTAAAYALAHYVIGSAMMQAAWQDRDEQAAGQAAERYLREQRDRYPVLAAQGHLTDWDTTFALGLEYLLTGVQAQSEST